MKIISACLCGINCKYDGGNNFMPYFLELLSAGEIIPVCPEQLGGLPTPRKPCELTGGTGQDVIAGNALAITRDGVDVTGQLIRGAQEALSIAINANAECAILKSRSPSCGGDVIYDGTFSGKLIKGDGITAAMLRQHGIKTYNEKEYLQKEGVCSNVESS